ncbi:similar to hypothetical protein FLJ21820, isoform CRA_b [Rattus norvegicus]|uniref:Uncharacterized protein RGD1311648 n=1 Tax=Rattus norvegicus TaxID=10116 RepID=A6HAL3_RAT|nr:similar to hypothetical protein FLJ21820, isoform CRA_b [Rattus norvegicus]
MASEVEDGVPVHEEFFLCGGVETQIIKCGPWTNLFDKQGVSKPKHLIFVIPGNPGLSPFYVPFAKALYSLVKGHFPVWIISHAGFCLTPKDKKILTAPQGRPHLSAVSNYRANVRIAQRQVCHSIFVPVSIYALCCQLLNF